MRWLSDKVMKRLIWILWALALYFLGSAFYIPAKAMLAQNLLATAWQRTLANKQANKEQANKPWPWADTYPVARLRVVGHAIDQIVLQGDQGNSLAFGPGLHPASKVTIDSGASGMVVISAHRDTHFNFLKDIRLGEIIELQIIDSGTTRYRVEDIQIVNINYVHIQSPDDNKWLTLVTCYPFNAIRSDPSLRYVVMAEAVDDCLQDCFI